MGPGNWTDSSTGISSRVVSGRGNNVTSFFCLRVQKCADLNQMCTKNLSLLFAPSLFQTDGKGEHEVKIVEDLIDNYLYVFDVSTRLSGSRVIFLCDVRSERTLIVFQIDEEHQTQIELEISLITTWKDTQVLGQCFTAVVITTH